MSEPKLSLCRCGGEADFATENSGKLIYAICGRCKIRTPSKGAGLEYSAKQDVADIWNAGTILWPPWAQGYQYQIGDQVTAIDQQNKQAHFINEKENNTQEPRQNGSGWRWIELAPTE